MILEVGSIAEDVPEFGRGFDGQLVAYVVNIVVDSFINTGKAFAWPMYVVRVEPPYGAIGLGLAFWLFPVFLKKPIENWLFDGEPPPEKPEKKDAK